MLKTDNYEPETIDHLFPELDQTDKEKLNALKVIKNVDSFFDDMHIFEKCVLAVNDIIPDFGFVEGCQPEHIWYTVSLASKLRPKKSYSWEVQKYCQYLFNENGVYIYPPQFTKLDNNVFNTIIAKLRTVMSGHLNIQRDKYLAIQLYIERKNQ